MERHKREAAMAAANEHAAAEAQVAGAVAHFLDLMHKAGNPGTQQFARATVKVPPRRGPVWKPVGGAVTAWAIEESWHDGYDPQSQTIALTVDGRLFNSVDVADGLVNVDSEQSFGSRWPTTRALAATLRKHNVLR